MRAFEHRFCAPLEIEHLGIASLFNGTGVLPDTYVKSALEITRCMALGDGDDPLAEAYDDITWEVNEPVRIDHLHWRKHPTEPAGPGE